MLQLGKMEVSIKIEIGRNEIRIFHSFNIKQLKARQQSKTSNTVKHLQQDLNSITTHKNPFLSDRSIKSIESNKPYPVF